MSSLYFFIKDVKYLEWFGNEKDKEEVYLGGIVSFVQVNIIVFDYVRWDDKTRFDFTFLTFFIFSFGFHF